MNKEEQGKGPAGGCGANVSVSVWWGTSSGTRAERTQPSTAVPLAAPGGGWLCPGPEGRGCRGSQAETRGRLWSPGFHVVSRPAWGHWTCFSLSELAPSSLVWGQRDPLERSPPWLSADARRSNSGTEARLGRPPPSASQPPGPRGWDLNCAHGRCPPGRLSKTDPEAPAACVRVIGVGVSSARSSHLHYCLPGRGMKEKLLCPFNVIKLAPFPPTRATKLYFSCNIRVHAKLLSHSCLNLHHCAEPGFGVQAPVPQENLGVSGLASPASLWASL